MRAASFSRDLVGLGDERRLQEEVFGRIAGDRELGERDEVAARGVGLLVRVEHARHVAGQVTDDEIELGRREAQPGHTPRIRGDCRRATLHVMTRPDAVLDAPGVGSALAQSADPHNARAVLSRVLEAQPELAPMLRDDRLVRDAVIAIACASRSLSAALATDLTLIDPIRDPGPFNAERTTADYRESVEAAAVADPDELRHWKRREYFRIAARDLLGLADLPTVGRELAGLAEVCLGRALHIVDAEAPLGVIAMGKLGGRELNYASDVDVLFVHDGDQAEADAAAPPPARGDGRTVSGGDRVPDRR